MAQQATDEPVTTAGEGRTATVAKLVHYAAISAIVTLGLGTAMFVAIVVGMAGV